MLLGSVTMLAKSTFICEIFAALYINASKQGSDAHLYETITCFRPSWAKIANIVAKSNKNGN